jgi:Tfp pilus assembly protein PilN
MSSIHRVRKFTNRVRWQPILLACGSLVLPIAGFVVAALVIEVRSDERQAQVEPLKEAINALDATLQEMSVLEADRDRFVVRLEIIRHLRRRNAAQAGVLWTASQFPAGVSLKQIEAEREVLIQGQSLSNGDVARAAARLAESTALGRVRIGNTAATADGLVDFTLTAQVEDR